MKEKSLLMHPDYISFERIILDNFSFLETDYGFRFTGIREINNSPHDQGVVARYSHEKTRIEIGCSTMEGSLTVLIKTKIDGLARAERHLYFEPFVEFYSSGKIKPIVPQLYPGMSVRRIEEAMEQREKCFKDGLVGVVEILAKKFSEYFSLIDSASVETIKQYHKWYLIRGKAS
ncbi:MAG: hypothetical protein V3U75_00290 [Methylococcaceae bacterium]